MTQFLIPAACTLTLIIIIGNLLTVSMSETAISNNQEAIIGQTPIDPERFPADCYFSAILRMGQICEKLCGPYMLAAEKSDNKDKDEDTSKEDSGPEPPDRIANSVPYG